MTVKNELTLPETVASRFPGVEYFEVRTDGISVTLRPIQPSRGEVWEHLEKLGITEKDASDAITLARQSDQQEEIPRIRSRCQLSEAEAA